MFFETHRILHSESSNKIELKQKVGTAFNLYSMKTLKLVDSGYYSKPIEMKNEGDKHYFVIRGVEYEYLFDW